MNRFFVTAVVERVSALKTGSYFRERMPFRLRSRMRVMSCLSEALAASCHFARDSTRQSEGLRSWAW